MFEEIVTAIGAGELQAYYQPQYNTKKGVIGGAEALVRWVKSDGTIIGPDQFIPELEKQGKVSIVDWFVAEETCKTLKLLKEKAVRISVNFGREHAKDKNFISKLNKLMKKYGVDKSLFGIEVTESDVATEREAVIKWVNEIEAAGYMVSIDDFGSGMSSMAFVKDVPARILKIDRAFLNDNCQTEKGRMALESVFYFAHRLKLVTVVECVETQEQLQFINTCDCDYIQGYIFSEPVSKANFLSMCIDEAPVEVGFVNPFDNKTMFGHMQILVQSLYKKFPLIAFVNISKNSYEIMRNDIFPDADLSSVGSYDDAANLVISGCYEEDIPVMNDTFSRKALLESYKNGEEKVVRIFFQEDKHNKDNVHRLAVEGYFTKNPSSDDLYMVTFMHSVSFDMDIYVGGPRFIALTK